LVVCCNNCILKSYRHIFFDLDRTLWDFDKNSTEALTDIVKVFHLEEKVSDIDEFVKCFHYYNDKLWDDFRDGKMRKQLLRLERFRLLLNRYEISEKKTVEKISQFYLNTAPTRPALIEDTLEILNYLFSKYKIYVISNGFYDVQLTKIVNSGIFKYFSKLFTSDRIGYAKPDKRIYEFVVRSIHAHKEDCIMIGDDVKNDIDGAKNADIDQVYFNPGKLNNQSQPTFEINKLIELKSIL
jgi:putative hydrolase of the HAD superfamily